MKVLHLLDSLNRGGAEIMALDLCRNARENGLDLTLVATGGGDLETEFANSGVEFIRLQRKMPIDPGVILQLRRIIKALRVDVVHSHQPVEAIHALLATKGTRVKRVMTIHGWIPTRKNRQSTRFVIPKMDANLVVSRDLSKWLKANEGIDTSRNFHLLLNGVDGKRLSGSRAALRQELSVSESALLLGTVGNFYFPIKNQITVCRALPEFFANVPDAQFVFAGGRSERNPELFDECVRFCRAAGISDRVHFLGKREDIGGILNALDGFVFPSLQEGMPISVIEAMLTGLPCIVSDIPPLREVTGGGEYSLVFPPAEPEALSASLVDFAQNRGKMVEMGAAGKRWAEAQFSIESYIARLKGLYSLITG
jgi:L-malate glycosyltransferase